MLSIGNYGPAAVIRIGRLNATSLTMGARIGYTVCNNWEVGFVAGTSYYKDPGGKGWDWTGTGYTRVYLPLDSAWLAGKARTSFGDFSRRFLQKFTPVAGFETGRVLERKANQDSTLVITEKIRLCTLCGRVLDSAVPRSLPPLGD